MSILRSKTKCGKDSNMDMCAKMEADARMLCCRLKPFTGQL